MCGNFHQKNKNTAQKELMPFAYRRLGFAVPHWTSDPEKEKFLSDIVREVIDLFGAERCMFNSNWHIDGAVSVSDKDTDQIAMLDLYRRYASWVDHLAPSQRDNLFAGNAERVHSRETAACHRHRRTCRRSEATHTPIKPTLQFYKIR